MDGRWTLVLDSHGTGYSLRIGDPGEVGTPVVPCDDAAVEQAVEELIGAPFDWRTYSPAQVVDVVTRALAGQSGRRDRRRLPPCGRGDTMNDTQSKRRFGALRSIAFSDSEFPEPTTRELRNRAFAALRSEREAKDEARNETGPTP